MLGDGTFFGPIGPLACASRLLDITRMLINQFSHSFNFIVDVASRYMHSFDLQQSAPLVTLLKPGSWGKQGGEAIHQLYGGRRSDIPSGFFFRTRSFEQAFLHKSHTRADHHAAFPIHSNRLSATSRCG